MVCLVFWLTLSTAVNHATTQLTGDLGCVSWSLDRRARFSLIVQHGLLFMGVLALALVPLAVLTAAPRNQPATGWNAAFHMGSALDALVSITILGIWFAVLTTGTWPRRGAVFTFAVLLILPAAIAIGEAWLGNMHHWAVASPYSPAATLQMPCAPLLLHLDRIKAEQGYVTIGPLLAYPFRVPLVGVFLPPLVNMLWAFANYWLVYWAILRHRPPRRAARTRG